MKIIDLLNRIANGEEVPKKFIVDGDTLYIGEDKFIEYANGKRIEWFIYPGWLNEEVEILEEEKKIPEKISIKKEHYNEYIEDYCFKNIPLENLILNQNEVVIIDKINEIIDYLDYLKSKGDE